MIEPWQSDDALLEDIANAPRDPGQLHLWWLGQSGYLAQSGPERLLFDPYLSESLTKKYEKTEKPHVRMSRRVVDPSRLSGIEVLTSTHNHTDHLDADTLLPIFAGNPKARLVLSAANTAFAADRLKVGPDRLAAISTGGVFRAGAIAIKPVPAAHDKLETDERGDYRCVGFVADFNGFVLYHSGDGVVYDGMAEVLGGVKPDVAFLPINGKVGNMNGADAARLAKQIGAKLVIPCHYDLFEFNTADPNEVFVPECKTLGQPYRVLRLGERLTLHRNTI